MKILLLAAALSLSGAAYAQAGQPPDSGDVSTPDATAPATAPDSTAPDTTAPTPDSTAPAATTSAPTSTDTATAPEASTKNYPPCSRTVTDNCMQGGGRHHARRR